MSIRAVLIPTTLSAVSFGARVLAAHDGDDGATQSHLEAINERLRRADATLSGAQSMLNQLTAKQELEKDEEP